MGHRVPGKDLHIYIYICILRHSSRGKPESSQQHFGVTESTTRACEKPGPVCKAFIFNGCVPVCVKEFLLYSELIWVTDLGRNRITWVLNASNLSHQNTAACSWRHTMYVQGPRLSEKTPWHGLCPLTKMESWLPHSLSILILMDNQARPHCVAVISWGW